MSEMHLGVRLIDSITPKGHWVVLYSGHPLLGQIRKEWFASIYQARKVARQWREDYGAEKNPIHPQALESLKRYKDDLKAGHKDAAEYWRGQAGAYFTANPSVALKWDNMHIQSREEIAINAGFQLKIAKKKWSELEPWIQLTLADSLVKRSKGKAHFTANPVRTIGRVDWMPRKKVWRVILYQGKKDVPFGDFASPEEAKTKLQSILRKKNPFVDAIATGLGFGAGMWGANEIAGAIRKKKKNPEKHWGKHTFKIVERSDIGQYGYCTVCLADMQAFKSDGYKPKHYSSHKRAIRLGLWGKRNPEMNPKKVRR